MRHCNDLLQQPLAHFSLSVPNIYSLPMFTCVFTCVLDSLDLFTTLLVREVIVSYGSTPLYIIRATTNIAGQTRQGGRNNKDADVLFEAGWNLRVAVKSR